MSTSHIAAEVTRFTALRHQILEQFPDLDETTLADTLEGATNLNEAVAAVIRSSSEDETMLKALKTRIDELRQRLDRIGARMAKKRDLALQALEEAGINKLVEADFTASIRNVPPSVVVTDEQEIPGDFLIPQPPKVDKRSLADALKSGERIQGAELSNPRRTLSVRIK